LPEGEFFGEDDFMQLARILQTTEGTEKHRKKKKINPRGHGENKKIEILETMDYYLRFAEQIVRVFG